MKSENAEGVFSDSLAINIQIDHFTSSFPGSSLFLARESPLVAAAHPCIQIKSALMVGPHLILSSVKFNYILRRKNLIVFLYQMALTS